MNHPIFFKFETDFIDTLRCIPMQVRFKLDTCGIKLKLSEWAKFSKKEKANLAAMPCKSHESIQVYRNYLQELVFRYTNAQATDLPIDPAPVWANLQAIPPDLVKKLSEVNTFISLTQWQKLTDLQRFALVKLCHSSHESKNFPHALKEFGL